MHLARTFSNDGLPRLDTARVHPSSSRYSYDKFACSKIALPTRVWALAWLFCPGLPGTSASLYSSKDAISRFPPFCALHADIREDQKGLGNCDGCPIAQCYAGEKGGRLGARCCCQAGPPQNFDHSR